jgi:hypothetical protein
MVAGSGPGPGRPAFPGEPGGPVFQGPTAGLLMGLAAVTLGVASYLHRDGHISLGFTQIHGESFYGASIPEAVIGLVLAVGAAVFLAAPPAARASAARGQARRIALVATTFAILGVAYGMSVTIADGRIPDIIYHSCLMLLVLITEALLLRGRTRRVLEAR